MNAFVVDFPEAPISESVKRFQRSQGQGNVDGQSVLQNNDSGEARLADGEVTLVTTDASFTNLKATPRRKSLAPSITPGTTSTMKQSSQSSRGGNSGRAIRGTGRGGRTGSGLPRGRGRGYK